VPLKPRKTAHAARQRANEPETGQRAGRAGRTLLDGPSGFRVSGSDDDVVASRDVAETVVTTTTTTTKRLIEKLLTRSIVVTQIPSNRIWYVGVSSKYTSESLPNCSDCGSPLLITYRQTCPQCETVIKYSEVSRTFVPDTLDRKIPYPITPRAIPGYTKMDRYPSVPTGLLMRDGSVSKKDVIGSDPLGDRVPKPRLSPSQRLVENMLQSPHLYKNAIQVLDRVIEYGEELPGKAGCGDDKLTSTLSSATPPPAPMKNNRGKTIWSFKVTG
jgi:hypothetical protein